MQPKPVSPLLGKAEGFALWVRMLFSCLVDADFLDTEAFMDEGKAVQRAGTPAIQELLPRFNAYMEEKFAGAPSTNVNRIRAEVLRQCRDKAHNTPGLFSLTVPTGGGKTLSSLAFALGTRRASWQTARDLRHSLHQHHRADREYFSRHFS